MPWYGREFGVPPRGGSDNLFRRIVYFLAYSLARNRSTDVNMVQYQSPRKSGFGTATAPVFGVALPNAWLRSLTRTRSLLVLRAKTPSIPQPLKKRAAADQGTSMGTTVPPVGFGTPLPWATTAAAIAIARRTLLRHTSVDTASSEVMRLNITVFAHC